MPPRHEIAGPPVAGPPVTNVPVIDVADETYIRVVPGVLGAVVADPDTWRHWWPDLHPVVTKDRGAKGQQWQVTGALRGSMEVWLEAVGGGTIVHWYLRADPPSGAGAGRLRRDRGRRVLAWKAHMFDLKDRVEAAAGLKDLSEPAESI